MENVFIHETAMVESETIGNNTKIWAYSHICKGAIIGDNCVIGEGVYVGPGVVIGNNCKVKILYLLVLMLSQLMIYTRM
jgi:UDP-3-O-[3-hydroxymyristoyl] glucosamine N-acyltransferase